MKKDWLYNLANESIKAFALSCGLDYLRHTFIRDMNDELLVAIIHKDKDGKEASEYYSAFGNMRVKFKKVGDDVKMTCSKLRLSFSETDRRWALLVRNANQDEYAETETGEELSYPEDYYYEWSAKISEYYLEENEKFRQQMADLNEKRGKMPVDKFVEREQDLKRKKVLLDGYVHSKTESFNKFMQQLSGCGDTVGDGVSVMATSAI